MLEAFNFYYVLEVLVVLVILFILSNIKEYMSIARRERLGDVNGTLSKERSIYLTNYFMKQNSQKENAK